MYHSQHGSKTSSTPVTKWEGRLVIGSKRSDGRCCLSKKEVVPSSHRISEGKSSQSDSIHPFTPSALNA